MTIKLEVYSKKDLQNFLSLIAQCEADGLTGVVDIRQVVETYIRKDISEGKTTNKETRKCKDCGIVMVYREREGLCYFACEKCRWSEVK